MVLLVRSPAVSVIEQFLYPNGVCNVLARQQGLVRFWFRSVARIANEHLGVLPISSQPEGCDVSFLLFWGIRIDR